MQSIAIKQTQNDRVWAYTTMAAVFALLFIWVVPNTIALRHVLLVIAFISSAMVIRANAELLVRPKTAIFPLAILSLLFIWVGFHYVFFSLNQELELKEISSLWVRTFLGFGAAIGLGISLRKYPELMKFFYIAVFLTPIINVGSYFYASYLKGGFLPPGAIIFFLFAKIETAYFGAIAGAVAVGGLIKLLTMPNMKNNQKKIMLATFGLLLVTFSSIASNTKNGIAILIFLYIFLVIVLCTYYLLNKSIFNARHLIALILILVIVSFVVQYHKSTASKGWESLFYDVAVATDIDKNKQWQKIEGTVLPPLNSQGDLAAQNTYSRAAWATVGLHLLLKHPLGYGSINQSFIELQKYAGIQNENMGQTHSGWIDFGLAFGIPGLAIIFLTYLSTIYFGLRNRLYSNLVPVVICITLIPFGLFAEISYKQYFESLIFFIALSSSMVAFNFFPLEHDS
jgi:hypothetical protein